MSLFVNVCAIVLAAGRSRRMGPGVQKLLLPYGNSTVVGHVVGQLLASPVRRVIVVVGLDERVAAAVARERVTVVRNEDPEADMLDSARCGLRALPPGCGAVLLCPGDQPSVTPELVGRLVDASAASGRGIVVPTYAGKRGHPLLFSAAYAPKVLGGYDGVGVRGLLLGHPHDVFELDVAEDQIVCDIDVPEDYRRALARLTPVEAQAPARRAGE